MIYDQHLRFLRGLYKSHFDMEFKRTIDTTVTRMHLAFAAGYTIEDLADTIGQALNHDGWNLTDAEKDRQETQYFAAVARLSTDALVRAASDALLVLRAVGYQSRKLRDELKIGIGLNILFSQEDHELKIRAYATLDDKSKEEFLNSETHAYLLEQVKNNPVLRDSGDQLLFPKSQSAESIIGGAEESMVGAATDAETLCDNDENAPTEHPIRAHHDKAKIFVNADFGPLLSDEQLATLIDAMKSPSVVGSSTSIEHLLNFTSSSSSGGASSSSSGGAAAAVGNLVTPPISPVPVTAAARPKVTVKRSRVEIDGYEVDEL